MRMGTTFSRATAPTMPHIALSFLGSLPAVASDLGFFVERQRAGRYVLPHRRARADGRAAPDGHRCDELRVGPDVHLVFDDRAVLFGAIVIARDRAGADVHVGADGGIAHVGEMIGL